VNYVSIFIMCLCLFLIFVEVKWLNYFVYCRIRMSQSIHNDKEVPIGGYMDQDQGASDQASHIVSNRHRVESQATQASHYPYEARRS